MSVSFHSEQINYTISNASSVSEWLNEVCTKEGKSLLEVSYIFCSDAYLLEMNRQFLDHDYFTDVITFNYLMEMMYQVMFLSAWIAFQRMLFQ